MMAGIFLKMLEQKQRRENERERKETTDRQSEPGTILIALDLGDRFYEGFHIILLLRIFETFQ